MQSPLRHVASFAAQCPGGRVGAGGSVGRIGGGMTGLSKFYENFNAYLTSLTSDRQFSQNEIVNFKKQCQTFQNKGVCQCETKHATGVLKQK